MSTRMVALLAGLTLSLAAASSHGKVPAKLLGKAFFTTERIKDVAPDAVAKLFEKSAPKTTLGRPKDGHWTVTMVAFFRKDSVPGPITIWLYDKGDKAALKAKEPVHLLSVETQPTGMFINDLDLSPDVGFNKGRTYLLLVGQIINKREKVYAQGEILLQ